MADLGMVGFGVLASRVDRRSAAARSHVELVLAGGVDGGHAGAGPARRRCRGLRSLLLGVSAAGGGGLYTLLTADMMARVDPARVSAAGGLTAAAQSLVYVVLNPIVGRWIDRVPLVRRTARLARCAGPSGGTLVVRRPLAQRSGGHASTVTGSPVVISPGASGMPFIPNQTLPSLSRNAASVRNGSTPRSAVR